MRTEAEATSDNRRAYITRTCVFISLLIHIIIGLAVGIFGILATVTLITKQDKINLSIIEYIGLMIRKNKEQQNFLYKYKDDYGIM